MCFFKRSLRCVKLLLLVALSLGNVVGAKNKAAVNSRPNLVFIVSDYWRGQAIGFGGKELVMTPYLDELAKESLVLEQMVSNYPLSSPARAMFMTAQYPLKNHVYRNVNSVSAAYGVELHKEAVCWSDILKQNGYSNGYIGKWHLDSPHLPYVQTLNNLGDVAWNEWTSPDRRHGFDFWYAYGAYDVHRRPMYWDTNAKRDEFKYVNQWAPIHEADKALEFLTNKGGKFRKNGEPFSLVVSMNPPHTQYQTVPQNYYDLYKNIPVEYLVKDPNIPAEGTEIGDQYRKDIRYYYANITGIDEQIGRVLKALKTNQLEDNTIVVVMSNYGNCLGKHSKDYKNSFYEESLRIPFIVKWKGQIKPRKDNTFLGSIPDIYPTILDLMGFKDKIPSNIDGKSYASYFKTGEGDKPTEQYILGGLFSSNINSDIGFRGVRDAEYKLVVIKKKDKNEYLLHNLQKDPYELNNLYSPNNKVVKRLMPRLQYWINKTSDGFNLIASSAK